MAKRGEGEKRRAKGRRSFALGDPGATIRIDYTIDTAKEKKTGLVTGIAFMIFGVLGGFAVEGRLVFLFVAFFFWGAWSIHGALRPSSGVVFLDDARLQIGPPRRTKDIALRDVVGVSRGQELSMLGTAGPEERWVVTFARRDGKPGADMAVATLPRPTIDELEQRVQIRARALRADDPRAMEAAEARWLAGPDAIGVVRTDDGWRGFSDTDELDATSAHPFRARREKLAVCVTAAVWEAIVSIPDLADRLEPIVVEER